MFNKAGLFALGQKHVERHKAAEKLSPLFPFCGFCNNVSKEPYKPLSSGVFKTLLYGNSLVLPPLLCVNGALL